LQTFLPGGAALAEKRCLEKDSSDPSWLIVAAHLFGLMGFAVGQTLFDLLAKNAEFFSVRGSQALDIVTFVLAVAVIAPLLLLLIEILIRCASRQAQKVTHAVFMTLLIAAFSLQVLKRLGDTPGALQVSIALLIGLVIVVIILRHTRTAGYLAFVSCAGLLFPIVFLLNPAIRELLSNPSPTSVELPSIKYQAKAPIVMVVFDALPTTVLLDESGGIDRQLYPNFARLADSSTWFRNATTVSDKTLVAIPATLTGLWPTKEMQFPDLNGHPNNLFSVLRQHYCLEIHEKATHLGSFTGGHLGYSERLSSLASDLWIIYLHALLPADLTGSLPAIGNRWQGFTFTLAGNESNDQQGRVPFRGYRRFLSSIRTTTPPILAFSHTILPHPPYHYYPTGTIYSYSPKEASGEGDHWGAWSEDEWAVAQSYQRFLLQVRFVDSLVGELITTLEQQGLWDSSLVVITADHGSSFVANDFHRGVTETNFHNILPVPLFIKAPFQDQSSISDVQVQSIDILPTIADILEIPIPWQMDGRSAAGESFPVHASRRCYSENRKQLTFSEADLQAGKASAVRRRIKLFGSGQDEQAVYRVGPASSIIRRHVDDLEVIDDPEIWVKIRRPNQFQEVDLSSGFVPGLIEGWLGPAQRLRHPQALAVAVNGIIRGTSQTYLNPSLAKLGIWSSLVAEESYWQGGNTIEVFLVESLGDGRFVLRAIQSKGRIPSLLNVCLVGCEPSIFSVIESGLYTGKGSRWTNGAASLKVPAQALKGAKQLRLELASTGPEGSRLQVLVEGHQLWDAEVAPGEWSRTFDISNIEFERQVTIEVRSSTFIRNNNSQRPLGVAIKGIWFLP
jgi:hypothetical protein